MTAVDLATLTDFGSAHPFDTESPFSLSPDGRHIALLVRRANPLTNSFCQRLLVIDRAATRDAVELDRGGDLIRPLFDLRNLAAVRAGTAQVITPRWSNDGSQIAFLKRIGDRTQIWVVSSNGGAAFRATDLDFEIEDFRWARDGQGFIVQGRPDLAKAEKAIDEEGRTGFLFDARFSPMMSDRPFPVGHYPTRYLRVGFSDQIGSDAQPEDIALFEPSADPDKPVEAMRFTADRRGNRAWLEKRDRSLLLSPSQLIVRWKTGSATMCVTKSCQGIQRLWWMDGREALLFLSRDGWGASRSTLYRWDKGAKSPILLMSTQDALVGCILNANTLICAREGQRQPRRLVATDVATLRDRVLFDPNPQMASVRFGTVHRLQFRNALGMECFADLVLPPDARLGTKLPMVVVQYNSRGFLRGGTGDEVPIQVLAARGFAVLSFERPFGVPQTMNARSEREYRDLARTDWIDRRSVQSALEEAIRQAVATQWIDPDRIGISGFSEGTTMTQWALINSRLFKVASLGVCCEDQVALPLNGGIGYEDYLREMGYPLFDADKSGFWTPLSLARNAGKIDVPILVQTSDDEYEAGLDVLQAFRERGNPIELYVFPDEPHIKWQPAHRLAMYERNVDWFAFWLKRSMDCAPEKRPQYARWQAMRGAPDLSGQCVDRVRDRP
ncbi:dipeptidyl aminopeptidase/acylaminoacyl peptidase [Sphingobium sp. B11D3B]|uniref:Atxe2 family lasso peptide isopeptidase n=1 Tax=Sphingobium sp. B11D3B TaxID=2940575 RepID=UPI002226B2A7|nr:Atxe2 family lasso peptide isopeptidase [Sphingobium sp. B11D3B]MCW2387176.1 dipeptidyl aminopeptidase/acylaminoacyl peptidase [Sphingobium sp. B11D3B]